MSLVATCPSCGTVFSMVREQLEASNGQVRCGHCMVVFDAKAPINPPPESISQNVDASPLANESEQPETDLSFVQQAKKQAFWSQKNVVFALLTGIFSLSLLLAIQILRSDSDRITLAVPALKPISHALCHVLTCTQSKRLQIDGWRIESSNFQKEGDNAFRLSLQLKNTQNTTLLIPQLELSLLDANEALLVRRTMPVAAPEESLAAGDERTYHFLINPQPDLATKVIGYKLVLFYP